MNRKNIAKRETSFSFPCCCCCATKPKMYLQRTYMPKLYDHICNELKNITKQETSFSCPCRRRRCCANKFKSLHVLAQDLYA